MPVLTSPFNRQNEKKWRSRRGRNPPVSGVSVLRKLRPENPPPPPQRGRPPQRPQLLPKCIEHNAAMPGTLRTVRLRPTTKKAKPSFLPLPSCANTGLAACRIFPFGKNDGSFFRKQTRLILAGPRTFAAVKFWRLPSGDFTQFLIGTAQGGSTGPGTCPAVGMRAGQFNAAILAGHAAQKSLTPPPSRLWKKTIKN